MTGRIIQARGAGGSGSKESGLPSQRLPPRSAGSPFLIDRWPGALCCRALRALVG